ncbi:MAG: Rrf2 family transcriptional regulator [Oscillospiraceae bacterium]|jgi:Rrf2 family protein|nr:Rrf2 family transcriptional regulator [Oscillospiraceae bacterium]
MKISTKGRYALRTMIDLARHSQTAEWIPLRDISHREDISTKYLEQIVQHLGAAGLVRSLRGPSGGYRLSRPAESYTAGEILRTIEGSLSPVACLEYTPNPCPRNSHCSTLRFYAGLKKVIYDYVDSITLQDLANDREEDEEAVYYI